MAAISTYAFKDKVKINENEILIELTNLKNINSEIKTYHLSEIETSFKTEKDKKEKIEKIQKSIQRSRLQKNCFYL